LGISVLLIADINDMSIPPVMCAYPFITIISTTRKRNRVTIPHTFDKKQSNNLLKNCIVWAYVFFFFFCEIRVTSLHKHLTEQLQIGSGMNLSNSSQILWRIQSRNSLLVLERKHPFATLKFLEGFPKQLCTLNHSKFHQLFPSII